MKNLFYQNSPYEQNAHEAAKAMAYEDRSDPYVYKRLMSAFKQGLELPSDVLKDAKRLEGQRFARLNADENKRSAILAIIFGLSPTDGDAA